MDLPRAKLKKNITYVCVEDGTPGYQVDGVVSGLWCASAAEALWLASPPYHSHLLRRQIHILLLLRHVLLIMSALLFKHKQ